MRSPMRISRMREYPRTHAFLSFYNYFVGGLIFHGGYSFIDYSNKKAIELLVSLLEV